jgi:hypothetical protein
MKKVFFAMFAAAFVFSLTTFAQVEEEQTQPEETVTAMAEEGMQIEFAQLPEAVQTAFEGSDYAAWDVTDIRAINEEQTESIKYKIKVTDGTKEESVLYNEEGEEVTEE